MSCSAFHLSKNCFLTLYNIYILKETKCEADTCQNGGTCIPDGTDDGFTCQCKAPFFGKNCEVTKKSYSIYIKTS